MTDVRLFHTADGGEIEFAGPDLWKVDIKLDTGLETAVYLSWFGGNERSHDHGDPIDAHHSHGPEWWGNIGEPVERQMLSETAHVVRSLPATSNNLLKVEDAMRRDLQWGIDDGTFPELSVSAALVDVDRLRLSAAIIVNKEEFVVAFEAPWGE